MSKKDNKFNIVEVLLLIFTSGPCALLGAYMLIDGCHDIHPGLLRAVIGLTLLAISRVAYRSFKE